MKDFLTRIVQRQRGELPTVQPRIEPMFAPESNREPGSSTQPVSIPDLPAVQEQRPVFMEKASRRLSLSERTASFVPLQLVSDAAPSGQEQQPLARHINRNATADAAQSRQEPLVQRINENATASPEKKTPLHNMPSASTYPTKPERSAAPQKQAAESNPAPAEVIWPSPREKTEHLTQTIHVEPPPRLVRPKAANLKDADSAPPSLAAAVPAKQPVADPQDASEPPVQVTIGRVEVTAVSVPTATKRKADRPKPAMSLENYLAQRQKGTQ
jgi:hypothetical protein